MPIFTTNAIVENNVHVEITYFDLKTMDFKQHRVAMQAYGDEEIENQINEFIKTSCEQIQSYISLIHNVKSEKEHPEDFCQECLGRNPTWSAKNELWNNVVGSPNGILCPQCFESLAESKNIKTIFRTEQL